ncbi:MAG: ATP-dependent helicase [Actinomycetota bacterium]|nr:ATP-dependent helicase [Actinomycetota bacterium]
MTRDATLPRLLAGCDDAQVEAITTDASPLLIVAGAGSGKTRVLTRRIARRVADGTAAPARTLAITFTRRAAGELRARLAALGLPEHVPAGTFHSVALGELRRRASDRGDPPPVVLDSKARLLALLLPDRYAVAPADRRGPTSARRDVLAALATEIEWAKSRLVAPDDYPRALAESRRTPALDVDLVATTFAAYEREKRKRRVLDFDDLLRDLATAVESEPDFAASQRWRYRHLFVDELQDATASQLRLLDAWLGGRDDVCAVGDPRQAIYGWSGALLGALEVFAERHPGAHVVHLESNYRSSTSIVAVASRALGARELAPASRDDGAVPTLRGYASDEEEAAAVADALRRARRAGRRWSDLAVLARTNGQLLAFEAALDAARAPYATGSGTALLAEPTARSALERVTDPDDTAAFVSWLDDLELEVRAPVAERHPEPTSSGSGRLGARATLEALLEVARDYRRDEARPTASGFQTWARAALRRDAFPRIADAVTLSTFHRSKGLEWEVVFVAGLEEGLVPIAHARSEDAVAEERRLLYVALSRAREELHCSWSATRTFGSRRVDRSPSRFLEAIDEARQDLEKRAARDPRSALAAIAAGREALASRRRP